MGKTPKNKQLTILVDEAWIEQPLIQKLREKGHHVWTIQNGAWVGLGDPDLILSTTAHYWDDTMWDTNLLEIAMKRARAKKEEKHG